MSDSSVKVDIDYIANLARLALTPEEKAKYRAQLENVLGHFEALNKVDVSNVSPISHAFDIYNVWQDDVPGETFTPEQALMNAPAQRDNQFEVPVVVEGE